MKRLSEKTEATLDLTFFGLKNAEWLFPKVLVSFEEKVLNSGALQPSTPHFWRAQSLVNVPKLDQH